MVKTSNKTTQSAAEKAAEKEIKKPTKRIIKKMKTAAEMVEEKKEKLSSQQRDTLRKRCNRWFQRIGRECIKNEANLRKAFPMIREAVNKFVNESETPIDGSPTETAAEKGLEMLIEAIQSNLEDNSSTMSMGEVYFRIGYNPNTDSNILQFGPSGSSGSSGITQWELSDMSSNDKIEVVLTNSHRAGSGSNLKVVDEMELMKYIEISTAPEKILPHPTGAFVEPLFTSRVAPRATPEESVIQKTSVRKGGRPAVKSERYQLQNDVLYDVLRCNLKSTWRRMKITPDTNTYFTLSPTVNEHIKESSFVTQSCRDRPIHKKVVASFSRLK